MAKIRAIHAEHHGAADLGDPVREAINGPLDVLVHNAGGGSSAPAHPLRPQPPLTRLSDTTKPATSDDTYFRASDDRNCTRRG